MKRNYGSTRGAGWSRAFIDAMAEPDEESRVEAAAAKLPSAPVCDRSADIGTKHIWKEDAQVGDLCLCGKRKKYPRLSEFGK